MGPRLFSYNTTGGGLRASFIVVFFSILATETEVAFTTVLPEHH